MLNVVLPIVPLLLVALIGFLIAKSQMITEVEFSGIGRFLVLCAVPALLFGAVARSELSGFTYHAFPLVFATSGLIAGVICYLICSVLLDLPIPECGTLALGASFPNSIAIGFPVAQQILGASILPMFALVVLVETLIFLPLGLFLLETAKSDGDSNCKKGIQIARRVFLNPIFLAIIAGLYVSGSAFTLPAIGYEAVDLLGRSVAAAALFYAGGLVARADMSLVGPATLVACAAKLIIAPAVASLLSVYFFPGQPIIAAAAILFSAAPAMSSLAAISVPYGTQRTAANVQGMSSTLALLTIPVVALLTNYHLDF